jgi:hypothetical protein
VSGKEPTWGDVYELLVNVHRKIERIDSSGPRFISRVKIIGEIGKGNYEYGVSEGYLREIKGPARNSSILIERVQYESFIESMKR